MDTPRTANRCALLRIDAATVASGMADRNKIAISAGLNAAANELKQLERELASKEAQLERESSRVRELTEALPKADGSTCTHGVYADYCGLCAVEFVKVARAALKGQP